MSRKRRSSKRWRKQRNKVARLHARVQDTRNDALHKLTRRLVDENQILCVESLNVWGLARSMLAASVHDAAWGELLRQLHYKADWAGRIVVAIDRWVPSTRRCSACGVLAEKFGLSVRRWQCAHCGAAHDRDINAAVNIRELGMAQLLPGGTGKIMRVEDDTHRGPAGKRWAETTASREARTGARLDGRDGTGRTGLVMDSSQ